MSGSLEQAGTERRLRRPQENATYRAWYELVPAPFRVTVALKVLPGDTITTTVTVAGSKVTMQVAERDHGTP